MSQTTLDEKTALSSQIEEDEDEELSFNFRCRFYEAKFPEVDELVIVKVKSIAEMGAYVKLLEYDNIEGMIQLSELSRKRIRSVSKLIRVGRREVVVVLRVDKEKGYIDLSKKRVFEEDKKKCEERFHKAKTVNDIMSTVVTKAKDPSLTLEKLNECVTWKLYKKKTEETEEVHALDALTLALTDPDTVFKDIQWPSEKVKQILMATIQSKLKPQPKKIRADLEVTCFSYEGIDAIKAALKKGEAVGNDSTPVKITLIAPPLYVIVTTTNDKNSGIELLEKSIQEIKKSIAEHNGTVVVKSAPRLVSAKDDHSLSVLLEQLKEQNKEVDGDADSEED